LTATAPAPTPQSTIASRAVDVMKIYGTGDTAVHALDGVSVDFVSGQFAAIMGPSGSGKSTLLHCLAGLDRVTSGEVWLGDVDISSANEKHLTLVRRDRIGFVFQAYNLLPRSTAFRNVELPLVYAGVSARERRGRALEALGEVGLADRAHHLPTQLSGGEQQRVAIARALVVHPSVVLLDEPTGNLDSASAEEVLTILERVNRQGATMVIVTHSSEVASRAARVLRLADGQVVADEPVDHALVLASAP